MGIEPPKTPDGYGSVLAIDFETANHRPDSGCALGVALISGGRIIAREAMLFRPFTGNDFYFSYLHGICWEDVESLGDFNAAWLRVAPLWEEADLVIAHNAPFDINVLFACARRARIVPAPRWYACTVALARQCWPQWRNHKLSTACEKLRIALHHHEAGSDAAACAELFVAAMQKQPQLHTQTYADWTVDRLPADRSAASHYVIAGEKARSKARAALAD